MAAGLDAIAADPAYLSYAARAFGSERCIVEATPNAMMGFDVPGFANRHIGPNTTGVARIGSIVTFRYSDELLDILPGSVTRSERYNYEWACRMWATGTGGTGCGGVQRVRKSSSLGSVAGSPTCRNGIGSNDATGSASHNRSFAIDRGPLAVPSPSRLRPKRVLAVGSPSFSHCVET